MEWHTQNAAAGKQRTSLILIDSITFSIYSVVGLGDAYSGVGGGALGREVSKASEARQEYGGVRGVSALKSEPRREVHGDDIKLSGRERSE